MITHKRPLSPHLQVYKPQLTSFMSITHRATGIFLSLGMLVLLYWLMAIAAGPAYYGNVQSWLGSILGRLALFCWTLALFYHLCNGIRHLFWDAGHGFEIPTVYASGRIVLVATVVLTFLSWTLAYAMRGGA